MGLALKKRKLKQSGVEEVVFDPTARFDYLTGFHKRKVQRTKEAQEKAAERARQDRIEARQKLRDERKAELEEHVAAVNATLPQKTRVHEPGSDEDDGEKGEEEEEWNGIPDAPPAPVDHEDEYVDEDKYTTVTVEEVDISRDGISKTRGEDEDERAATAEALSKEDADKNSNSIAESKPKKKPPPWKRDLLARPKKKKKTFRYESPADRKANRLKEKAKKSKQAAARKAA